MTYHVEGENHGNKDAAFTSHSFASPMELTGHDVKTVVRPAEEGVNVEQLGEVVVTLQPGSEFTVAGSGFTHTIVAE